jgi:hypothetical protein
MKNEYNGIHFGEKCIVWDDDKDLVKEQTFVAYFPYKTYYPILTAEGEFYAHAEPLTKKEAINRLEVIGPQGREHVLFGYREYEHDIQLQDDGKTLKIFLTEVGK